MAGYDDRRATLDPGLTALALRARRGAARYPFVDEARSRRGWLARLRARWHAWRGGREPDSPAPPTAPRG